METMPKKEDGNGHWFIRPHHLENLTGHAKSINDDVLNTRYYSHYNLEEKPEENIAEKAVEKIEEHIARLKNEMNTHMVARGEDPELHDKLYDEVARESMEAYDKFISDRNRNDNKKMIIEAYEDILTYERSMELELLNKQRNKEYEKNREPKKGWYMMKSSGFQKELYRNRVALKPNNLNAVYLENLLDQKLY